MMDLRRAFVVLLGLLLLMCAAGFAQPTIVDQALAGVEMHLEAGRIAKAEEALRPIITAYAANGPDDLIIQRGMECLTRIAESKFNEDILPSVQYRLAFLKDLCGVQTPLLVAPLLDLAEYYASQGRAPEALPHTARAVRLCEIAYGTSSWQYVEVLSRVGHIFQATGDVWKADAYYQRALTCARSQKALKPQILITLLDQLGDAAFSQGHYTAAARYHEELVACAKKYAPTDPLMPDYVHELAMYYHESEADSARVIATYHQALRLYRAQEGEDGISVALALTNLSFWYQRVGRLQDALRCNEQALRIYRQRDNPTSIAESLTNAASICYDQGKYREAERYVRESIAVEEIHTDEDGGNDNTLQLGEIELVFGRFSDAEPHIKQAISATEGILGDEHRSLIGRFRTLIRCYIRTARFSEARKVYKRLLAIESIPENRNALSMARTRAELAEIDIYDHHPEAALTTLHEVLPVIISAYGYRDADVAWMCGLLGMAYAQRGKDEVAQVYLRRAIATERAIAGGETSNTAYYQTQLARVYLRQARLTEAQVLLNASRAYQHTQLGAMHFNLAETLHVQGDLSMARQRVPLAAEFYTRAFDIRRVSLGLAHPDTRDSAASLRAVLRTLGRDAEIEALDALLATPSPSE